jgi:hypothetical protein
MSPTFNFKDSGKDVLRLSLDDPFMHTERRLAARGFKCKRRWWGAEKMGIALMQRQKLLYGGPWPKCGNSSVK